ncbi:hypothetical protein FHS43_000501 [Streptosporangium becharense]|uniref:Putative metalloprotease n=1 Tax=Streptosporangium becharense TaxID=1816182 RepID=A0A7W9IG60_9ACTN|nr:neutral zinc metallopeptidase [Streptosporangium becharense]MBB2909255.1 hypothetical protein [Streptosporangium becharense]MBB5819726.1 putative metalloprotease [Streptosporangium becharense]
MRPRGPGPLVFGVFGVLAMAFAMVVVIAGLLAGDEAEVPANPGTVPVVTENPVSPPAGDVEITPPPFTPPQRLNFGPRGGSRVALAATGSVPRETDVDLRQVGRSDTAARLKRNPLYGTGLMRPTSCRVPRPSAWTDDMLAYLNAATDCMDRAWSAKFSQAGALFLPPQRIFWTRPGRGPCGVYPAPDAAAYYCPANRGLYIGVNEVIQQNERIDPARNHVPYLTVLAHEYGHHVQSMAGIGGAWWQEVSHRSRSAQDTHSRRNELQAQCFAGVFIRTVRTPLGVTGARWKEALRVEHSRGDDRDAGARRDRGSGDNYAAWLHQGWKYARVAHCNTWAVPPSRVD